ncbi:hypothetical protein RRG08_046047 [Elysia crispata]|uniref:Uncharacterized protein n=1 Tax=Elysia crispata TaxID=231223 RepID=A0AAE1A945_9GAST|nr:hypothetical protein RRG08_046047 [Elysia crispata]
MESHRIRSRLTSQRQQLRGLGVYLHSMGVTQDKVPTHESASAPERFRSISTLYGVTQDKVPTHESASAAARFAGETFTQEAREWGKLGAEKFPWLTASGVCWV